MMKILALVAVIVLLGGCSAPKDYLAEDHVDLSEQISVETFSNIRGANTKLSDAERKKAIRMKKSQSIYRLKCK